MLFPCCLGKQAEFFVFFPSENNWSGLTAENRDDIDIKDYRDMKKLSF